MVARSTSTDGTPTPTGSAAEVKGPRPGVWKLDAGHADVGFWGRHFMLTKVRGRFRTVDATVHVGERPEDSTVEAIIHMASVDSGDETRDDHLRSGDFFDVERWPTAAYRSTSITWDGITGTMVGDLTIKDTTHQVKLDVELLGAVQDPWGGERAVFSALGTINREHWNLTWNMVLDSGGLLVSKEIHLEFHVELVREES